MKKIIVALCLIVIISSACIYWHLQTTVSDINERRNEEFSALENQPAIEQPPLDVPLATLLKLAIHTNNTENLESLVKDHNLDINQAGLDGKTILTYAIGYSNKLPIDVAISLITFIVNNLRADINQEDFYDNDDDESYIPFTFAITHDVDQSLIETLINLGANINYQSQPSNQTLLESAFDKNDTALIAFLIAHGANMDNFNHSGTSILNFAIIKANNLYNKSQSLEMIQAILDGLLVNTHMPNIYKINILKNAIQTAKQLNLDPEIINLLEQTK